MHPRRFSLIAGIVLVAVAVLSFIPSMNWGNEKLLPLQLDTSYGMFLGLFAMNILNKLVLLAFGIGGIVASSLPNTNVPASIFYARAVFYFMGLAAILGFIPQTQTLGGNWPLYGYEAIAHAVFAAFGAYFGYRLPIVAHDRLVERHLDPKHA